MATIAKISSTKLSSGKYRAQIQRNGVYRAQTPLRKLGAQAWSSELKRAIEGGSSAGVIQPSSALLVVDVI